MGKDSGMSSAGIPLEVSQGYSPPTVTQFSVFLDNKVGKLLELVEEFKDDTICQLCALSVHEASDHAVVRILPNCADAARLILEREGYPFAETNLLVVELGGGHTVRSLCRHLLGAEINIYFAYPVLVRLHGAPTIAISVDDVVLGGQLLRRKGYRLLGEGDLPHTN